MYRAAEGVPRDKTEALRWYHLSARQGNGEAMCNLGAAYYNGDGTTTDDSLSYAWFLLAKDAGCSRAEDAVKRAELRLKLDQVKTAYEDLARLYETGEFLPANESVAVHWWQLAADRGDEDAEFEMATRLVPGKGLPQDIPAARQWCDKVRKSSEGRGNFCLAITYQTGPESSRDLKKARSLYERASTYGDYSPAMSSLAQMEAAGQGGKLDRVSASVLYAQLIRKRDPQALSALANVKSQMNDKEWAQVEKRLITKGIDPKKLGELLQQVPTH